jgi:hypothetical protein
MRDPRAAQRVLLRQGSDGQFIARLRILTPNPLSKNGEGASDRPLPRLGKGIGVRDIGVKRLLRSRARGPLVDDTFSRAPSLTEPLKVW